MVGLKVASLNVRNTADRWRDRRPHLIRQLVALAPDVVGLQELRSFPSQAGAIVDSVWRASGGRMWFDHRFAPKRGVRGLWEGLAVLSRLPVVTHSVLSLGGQSRVAQRVTVNLPEGRTLDFYNTHLATGDRPLRTAQAAALLEWIDQRPGVACVVVGDLNSGPGSPAVAAITARMRSAHVATHGREPERTVPTPLRSGITGDGRAIDYIFVSDDVVVLDASVTFDHPDPADSRLYASDHYGLTATVFVG